EGLNADAFGSFERADGQMQTTYRGYPLYTFSNDNAPGDTNGEGVGNVWYTIVVPFYDALILNTTNQDIGLYLADGEGSTLYVFANDTPARGGQAPVSACEGGCINTWPVFHVPLDLLKTVSVIDIADFGEYQRADGQMQTTYRGYPLYSFSNDVAPGDTNGEGVGGNWFTLDPLTFEGFEPPVEEANVELSEDDVLGTILTDGEGNTLYYFANDVPGAQASACVDGCAATWPTFYEENIVVGEGLNADAFGSFERADGQMQTTYRGYP
ncbi:MAG: hypothetical protein AAFX99_36975, partial [Myxococcota bacterium]